MALFDFTLDDQSVGQTIGPANGFLVNLTLQTPPSVYETPDHNPATQQYKSGYFVLRGSGDTQNLYCSLTGYVSNAVVRSHGLGYRGDLVAICVPRGSTWLLTLSDVALSQKERNELGKAEAQKALAAYGAKLAAARASLSAAPQPHGTARKAEAILQAARSPA
jgi:hypothetical protein